MTRDPKNERGAFRLLSMTSHHARHNGWRIGSGFYTPGKGYRVNGWRRIVRALLRMFT